MKEIMGISIIGVSCILILVIIAGMYSSSIQSTTISYKNSYESCSGDCMNIYDTNITNDVRNCMWEKESECIQKMKRYNYTTAECQEYSNENRRDCERKIYLHWDIKCFEICA